MEYQVPPRNLRKEEIDIHDALKKEKENGITQNVSNDEKNYKSSLT